MHLLKMACYSSHMTNTQGTNRPAPTPINDSLDLLEAFLVEIATGERESRSFHVAYYPFQVTTDRRTCTVDEDPSVSTGIRVRCTARRPGAQLITQLTSDGHLTVSRSDMATLTDSGVAWVLENLAN